MKKSILSAVLAVFLLSGCTNDPRDFPNYTVQAIYFPYQYPVRTLVLGESTVDNSIDLQHAFNIGACIGGMYENTKDWNVSFGLAPEYLNYLTAFQVSDPNGIVTTVKMMPSNYYNLGRDSTTLFVDSTIVIPKGSFSGLLRVNLKAAFFNDSDSYKTLYVLPIKIKSASSTILTGNPAVSLQRNPYPNPVLTTDWATGFSPMNFTLFAVKYINPWHGTFFYRGKQYKNGVLDNSYHQLDQELNTTASVATAGFKKCLLKRMGTFVTSTNVSKMTFSTDSAGIGNITLSSATGSLLGVSGTGKYYKSNTDFAKDDMNAWLLNPITGKKTPHLTMTLDYTVTGISAGNTYHFVDTLVMRDNAMIFQTFAPYLPVALTHY
ncbi:MAG: DUF1735 domain-containing protein [Bacteroidia bacterium]|nr:DUF1735 domain-containing protein [Bacteroidia bacterium]